MAEQKDIELICRLSENWTPESITVKRMGGETNKNYQVEDKEGKLLVVRLPWEGTEIIDRAIEAQNILALRQCQKIEGVLPRYYLYLLKGRNVLSPAITKHIDLPDGTMVMSYIEGKELDTELLKKENVQEALVRTLYSFHTSGVRFANLYNSFQNEILKYKSEAKRKPITELVETKMLEEVEEIEKMMEERLPLEEGVPTHNDLIFGNLLLGKDGSIYLLDFEYAGFNIRGGLYYDFGTLLGENLFQEKPLELDIFEEILKKASAIYGREFNPQKVYYGAMVDILVTFWWGLVKYFSSKREEERKYFREYIPKRIQRMKTLREIIK